MRHKKQENPFELGVRAGMSGQGVRACPFSTHSRKWVRWLSGWQAGRNVYTAPASAERSALRRE